MRFYIILFCVLVMGATVSAATKKSTDSASTGKAWSQLFQAIGQLSADADAGADAGDVDCGMKGSNLIDAVAKRNTERALQLIAVGCDVNARLNSGSTALHFATAAVPVKDERDNIYVMRPPSVELVLALLAAGAEVSHTDEKGRTPLHRLFETRVYALAADATQSADVADATDATQSADATEVDGLDFTDLPGVDARIPEVHTFAILVFLVNFGADIDARDDNGETALMYAAQSDYKGHKVKMLLKYNADATLVNDRGESVLDLAKKFNNDTAARIIEEHLRENPCVDALKSTQT